MKYLLPCSCGKSVAIEYSQAGGRVQCDCGRLLDVPTLRLIRQLTPVPTQPQPTPAAHGGGWPVAWRLLFAAGLLLGVGGVGIAVYYQLWRAQLITEEVPWDNIEQVTRDIDNMSLEQTWELWQLVRTQEIGPYRPPGFIRGRLVSAEWKKNVYIALATAAVGACLTACAVVVGPRAARRTAPPGKARRRQAPTRK